MDLIWYACCGSNMDSGRFLKYIQGGDLTVNGQIKRYDPCPTDRTAPRSEEKYIINRRFYFAEKSRTTWGGHGVGFISTESDSRSIAYVKLYLISKIIKYLFGWENAGNPRIIKKPAAI